jgi:hypothetical protein
MEFLLPWLVSAASGSLNKNSPPTGQTRPNPKQKNGGPKAAEIIP